MQNIRRKTSHGQHQLRFHDERGTTNLRPCSVAFSPIDGARPLCSTISRGVAAMLCQPAPYIYAFKQVKLWFCRGSKGILEFGVEKLNGLVYG
jgi:hypothetical protein